MKILLAHNSLYYPSFGGGDKSNRLLMEALASRGHAVVVVARVERFDGAGHARLLEELAARGVAARVEGAGVRLDLNGVAVRVLTRDPHLRAYFGQQLEAFDPDVVLTSTDDPAHVMLGAALRAARARVVYLVRATIALPFGPDASFPSEVKTEALRQCDGVLTVSEYVARYGRRWGGLDAVHVPISLLEGREFPPLGGFGNRFVTMVNPCAVKGISIFLGLAERMPEVEFAAVPTWGTTAADVAALRRAPNVTVLPPVDDINEVFAQTRVALVPSIWAEARSRVILEAMARGIPVLASDVGGLKEAKLGVDYLLPVNPVVRYHAAVDELMVPAAEVPEQDVEPWRAVLARLLSERKHYEALAEKSRRVALEYAEKLTGEPVEKYLEEVLARPRRAHAEARGHQLSPDKKQLLALLLKKRKAQK